MIVNKHTKSNNFSPLNLTIPSDTSTASFFIAAAILISDSRIKFNRLLLNPTRIGFLNALIKTGLVRIKVYRYVYRKWGNKLEIVGGVSSKT
jgi:5-enolpyruvylshikimate-3-phosphate synthase